jgi:hypothetical protein
MNKHLKERVEQQLNQYESVTLATCGGGRLEISKVAYQTLNLSLYLLIPHGSDHLFNLETQPEIVLLSPAWKLNGRGTLLHDHTLTTAHPWQTVVQVEPDQLHILGADGYSSVETIDF